MARQIAKLTPGESVTLRFHGSMGNATHDDQAVFVGLFECDYEPGRMDARFVSLDHVGSMYTWEAYRFGGRWSYGTSADRLSIVD